ncbi:hypothetical protein CNBG_10020 [Cryptococcus deuterogattii R265]|uniref:uncharacterized protein n=1 Tax=Cryptococcus deuterogattii (strain R265) TaxID=294750 RepID=UPI001934CA45|nr:hypothetical protein CNBG_10020 [Cryptococcus deuterogattii R265]
MVPKITSASSMKTKHPKHASCRARSKIPLTPTSPTSPPLPPNIRSSPAKPMKFVISFETPSRSCTPRWTAKHMGGTRIILHRTA